MQDVPAVTSIRVTTARCWIMKRLCLIRRRINFNEGRLNPALPGLCEWLTPILSQRDRLSIVALAGGDSRRQAEIIIHLCLLFAQPLVSSLELLSPNVTIALARHPFRASKMALECTASAIRLDHGIDI